MLNSQDVILGMLMKEALTGYQIKQLLETVFSNFYSSSYGTIYPTLARMEKEGLITKENVPQDGKPNKNLINITPKGRERFNAYLLGPLEEDSIRKSDFMMRLYFGEFVGYDKVIAWLRQAEEESRRKLDQLLEQHSLHKNEMHPAQVICIQIGIEEYKAKLATIAEGVVRLEKLIQEQG
ncbi:PadR family transcriptional regulator [Paenibacillus sp. YPG26]|uniref:PadR family transcriptional regulator n=1 Tax=Paenibacillus sp. YPG26 TaxID=2878915 RepID=UPI00203CCA72|nr:PadR family transcriptional regulator [Paenibacillus sp. YPG26]USB33190.1 PadR family transcriptional regulator [Paenibacillus sp. YPG26]